MKVYPFGDSTPEHSLQNKCFAQVVHIEGAFAGVVFSTDSAVVHDRMLSRQGSSFSQGAPVGIPKRFRA